jgi:hypothetical protein
MEIAEKNPTVGVIGLAGSSLRLEQWFWESKYCCRLTDDVSPRLVPTKSRSVSTAGTDPVVDQTPSLGNFDRDIVYQAGISSNDSIVNHSTFQFNHCLDVPFCTSGWSPQQLGKSLVPHQPSR